VNASTTSLDLRSYGLLADVVECVGTSVNNLTLNLICPSSVVSDASRSSGNVALGHGNRLSIVKSLNGGKCLNITVEELSKLVEELASVAW
jgi:hypothetical protein